MPRRSQSRHNHDDYTDDDEEDEEGPSPRQRASTSRRKTNAASSRTAHSDSQASQNTSRATAAGSGHSRLRASQRTSNSYNDHSVDFEESTQSSQKSGSKLQKDEENNLVASVIRYLLVMDRSKKVIHRANIIKAALPNHSKYYKYLIGKVQETLSEVFGYNLVQLEGSKYILTNNLKNDRPHLNFSKTDRAEQVLLFITLAHIFMGEENGCKEENLFDLFRKLEIIEDNDFNNEYFGDVKYLVTNKFIKQGYLDLVTFKQPGSSVPLYQWGVRAENELTPRQVLEFMSKIFGGRPLNSWPSQFKIMQMREESNTEQ